MKSLAVFLCEKMECEKIENLHLPRKPESKRKAVVLERSGSYHYLCRDSTVCDSACESLEHYPLCSYSLLCFCDCKSR